MWSYTVDASLVTEKPLNDLVKSSMKYPLCSFCGFLGVLVEQKNKGMHCIGDVILFLYVWFVFPT